MARSFCFAEAEADSRSSPVVSPGTAPLGEMNTSTVEGGMSDTNTREV
jgi:hypothetical protein